MKQETLARLLVLVLVGAATIPLISGPDTPLVHARLAEAGGWTPGVLRAKAGEPFALRLTSDDVLHGFGVGHTDFEPVLVAPGTVTDVTLTFDEPGTYTYYCTVWCGLNHWRMRGIIVVEGETTSAAPPEPPLYVQLGIDIDAPHLANVQPAARPDAANAPDSDVAFTFEQYAATSPAQMFAALGSQPGLENLTDTQRWNLVAALWAGQTSPAALA